MNTKEFNRVYEDAMERVNDFQVANEPSQEKPVTRDQLDLMIARLDPRNFNATSEMVNLLVSYIEHLEQALSDSEDNARELHTCCKELKDNQCH